MTNLIKPSLRIRTLFVPVTHGYTKTFMKINVLYNITFLVILLLVKLLMLRIDVN